MPPNESFRKNRPTKMPKSKASQSQISISLIETTTISNEQEFIQLFFSYNGWLNQKKRCCIPGKNFSISLDEVSPNDRNLV